MDKLSLLGQGISIAIIGISVVFFSLLLLFLCMKFFLRFISNSKKTLTTKQEELIISGQKGTESITGEIVAAIAMAIHRSREEFHDLEQMILTFNRITRPYSPWSSKIHGIRRFSRN